MSKTDYDLTRIRAFVFDVDGVLSPSTIPMDSDGVPRRMVNIKDGYALQLAAKHGYRIAIITGGVDEAVKHRYAALGLTDIFMGSSMKLPILNKWMKKNAVMPYETVFVGDDVPDYECMKAVDLAVAPRDAAADILQIARYISDKDGGYGVARDIIEQVMKAQGTWMSTEESFGW